MDNDFAESMKYGMGTVITHRVFGPRKEEALHAAEEETARLEGMLSRFLPDSDISRIGAAAAREAVNISDETLEVLSRAQNFSSRSRGAFDATIGPLVSLWRDRHQTLKPPDRAAIQNTLSLVNYKALTLDLQCKTARLKKQGQSLDLGGVGKGYASDKIVEAFRKYGITSAFTNFGGNVAALGSKPDGSPWRVGIRHPRKTGALIGAVDIADSTVVTSGDDQRYFIGSDGKRYHHILNPQTGYPSDSGLISATVVTESAVDADALSTILFVLGLKKGLRILKEYQGAGAVLIDKSLRVYITPGLAAAFSSADGVGVQVLNY